MAPAVAGCVHTARTRGEGRANQKAQRLRLGVPCVGDVLGHLEYAVGISELLVARQTSSLYQRQTYVTLPAVRSWRNNFGVRPAYFLGSNCSAGVETAMIA